MLTTTNTKPVITRPTIVVNFPYYFGSRSSMGVFFKDLYDALSERDVEVRTACLAPPAEIPSQSHITPIKAKRKLIRFLSYYWQLTLFMRKNPRALLLNISQEFAFTPCPSRTITIVHDLIQLRFPRTWWIRRYIGLMLKFIRRSRLNIAVSATTQARLRQYGIESIVRYNWFTSDLPATIKDCNMAKTFDGLFIGNQLPHKNMSMFLRLAQQFSEYRFAAIVPKMACSEIAVFAQLSNLTIFTDLSQREYVNVIAQSKTLISPSLDEGFGRPPMEASLVGLNLLLSDIPIYRELYKDVAIFFPLECENELFEKFADLTLGRLVPPGASPRQAEESIASHRGDPQQYVHAILATIK